MGVYIKDMEMPKNCMLCPLCVEEADPAKQERRCLWWFEQQIGIAPTIIPAEEGEA